MFSRARCSSSVRFGWPEFDLNEEGPPEEAPSPPEPFLVCLKADDIDGRLVLVGDGEDSYEFKRVDGQ